MCLSIKEDINQRALRVEAKRIACYLNHHLPQGRFWICPHELKMPEEQGNAGALAVFHGVPLSAQMSVTEHRELRGISGVSTSRVNLPNASPKLDPFDLYACIGSLNVETRLRLILHPPNPSAVTTPSDPLFISTATTFSLAQCFDLTWKLIPFYTRRVLSMAYRFLPMRSTATEAS